MGCVCACIILCWPHHLLWCIYVWVCGEGRGEVYVHISVSPLILASSLSLSLSVFPPNQQFVPIEEEDVSDYVLLYIANPDATQIHTVTTHYCPLCRCPWSPSSVGNNQVQCLTSMSWAYLNISPYCCACMPMYVRHTHTVTLHEHS